MAKKKDNFVFGHAELEDLAYWINERDAIWRRRSRTEDPPWTKDEILAEWRFCNVFRELDYGTIVLRDALPISGQHSPELVLFNVVWYRMLNWYENLQQGLFLQFDDLREFIRARVHRGEQVITNAHLTLGTAGMPKHESLLDTVRLVFDDAESICEQMRLDPSLEGAFKLLTRYHGIGPFIGYEMVTDLRFYPQVWGDRNPSDVHSWANLGPGAKRGLARLGMSARISSLVYLDQVLDVYLTPELQQHKSQGLWPRWELREIEHSLCEFDKYQRVKCGQGNPRMRYRPRGE